VIKSQIPAEQFWIWTPFDNKASLRGIVKAGGKEAGEVIQRKWLWGLFSSVQYHPLKSCNHVDIKSQS
jgi:hypothetical protein